jgi:hypothetical protein
MSLTGIVLGLINIIIVIVILLLIGALIKWILNALLGITVPALVEKLYLALVGLIALYMLVAMLLGIPTWAPVRF